MSYYVVFRYNKKSFGKQYLQNDYKFQTSGDGFLTAKKFFDESAAEAMMKILSNKDKSGIFLVQGIHS